MKKLADIRFIHAILIPCSKRNVWYIDEKQVKTSSCCFKTLILAAFADLRNHQRTHASFTYQYAAK